MSELLMDWHIVCHTLPVAMLTIVMTHVPVMVVQIPVKTSTIFSIPEMGTEVIIVPNPLVDKVLVWGLLEDLLFPLVLLLLSMVVGGCLGIDIMLLLVVIIVLLSAALLRLSVLCLTGSGPRPVTTLLISVLISLELQFHVADDRHRCIKVAIMGLLLALALVLRR